MNQQQDTHFAQKICRALNERLVDLPESVINRLSQARLMAIARKKEAPAWSFPVREFAVVDAHGILHGVFSRFSSVSRRIVLSLAALALVVSMAGYYYYEEQEQEQIQIAAALDMDVLTDELPLSAYTDSGFRAFLERDNGA